MKQRSIGKMFGLFIVTLGFYRLYWLAKTRGELQEKTKLKIPSVWLLLIPYVLVIASLTLIVVSTPSAPNEVDYTRAPANSICPGRLEEPRDMSCYESESEDVDESNAAQVAGIIILYASLLVVFPLMGWWYWKYAQAVEKVTNEKLSFPVTMLIMLAVPDIFDMLIVQDSFNKLGKSKKAQA